LSATGRSDVRDPDDFYETPAWCVHAILPHLPSGGRVLDPGCGTGAILRAIMATPAFAHADLHGIELDADRAEQARGLFCGTRGHQVETGDFFTGSVDSANLVVANPPFSLAMEFVARSIAITKPYRGTVAMLLRLNWLASQERLAFHRANPSDVFILPRRPSFCASLRCKVKCGWHVLQKLDAPRAKECPACGGAVVVTTSDSTEYAWFVFGPGRGNRWSLLHVPELA